MEEDIDADIKRAFVRKQFEEAKGDCNVTCGCELRLPLRFAYRCLYCGEFYCQSCAEDHFGKTRDQYFAEKEKDNAQTNKDKAADNEKEKEKPMLNVPTAHEGLFPVV